MRCLISSYTGLIAPRNGKCGLLFVGKVGTMTSALANRARMPEGER